MKKLFTLLFVSSVLTFAACQSKPKTEEAAVDSSDAAIDSATATIDSASASMSAVSTATSSTTN